MAINLLNFFIVYYELISRSTFAQPNSLGTIACGQIINDDISSTGDKNAYQFTVTTSPSREITFKACDGDWDLDSRLYYWYNDGSWQVSPSCDEAGGPLGCSGCGHFKESWELTLTPGTYYIQIQGWGSVGNYNLEMQCNTPPPTTKSPTTKAPTTKAPTTQSPTTQSPTTQSPTTQSPTTKSPTTKAPTTSSPTTKSPSTQAPTTKVPTTQSPTTASPTTETPTTNNPTSSEPTTAQPSTNNPTTSVPTTSVPTTSTPTTSNPTTNVPTTSNPAKYPTYLNGEINDFQIELAIKNDSNITTDDILNVVKNSTNKYLTNEDDYKLVVKLVNDVNGMLTIDIIVISKNNVEFDEQELTSDIQTDLANVYGDSVVGEGAVDATTTTGINNSGHYNSNDTNKSWLDNYLWIVLYIGIPLILVVIISLIIWKCKSRNKQKEQKDIDNNIKTEGANNESSYKSVFDTSPMSVMTTTAFDNKSMIELQLAPPIDGTNKMQNMQYNEAEEGDVDGMYTTAVTNDGNDNVLTPQRATTKGVEDANDYLDDSDDDEVDGMYTANAVTDDGGKREQVEDSHDDQNDIMYDIAHRNLATQGDV